MSSPSPLAYLSIRNTLSLYCEALDTKNFALLHSVFTPDVVANYPFNTHMSGVEEISGAIQKRLGPILTSHNLTTQTIEFSKVDARRASARTYFVAVHFGQGPREGEMLQAFGRYVDELVCLDGGDGGEEWRIEKRTVVFVRRVGDERVMSEF
ncbi:hypothetical protein P153DRAFT_381125 [Dothidotthia symphoricarpi CBS 119687]|uniref:SnoaL-like domain-containing protein n=1 Tax=Dothidotthia symphoricarpi CBS 119687 TaxID=1392245 RepID=A0A6A6APN2_9PLEO|nr:uncharacterized protein P153DRAFT_381125 [Dothidotthia symphoricarpi CBS 119687]KAF2133952.1 hypothetical protein P153DRAFT_381125 [Dothidotthia symphoricarpi CBS 119687]